MSQVEHHSWRRTNLWTNETDGGHIMDLKIGCLLPILPGPPSLDNKAVSWRGLSNIPGSKHWKGSWLPAVIDLKISEPSILGFWAGEEVFAGGKAASCLPPGPPQSGPIATFRNSSSKCLRWTSMGTSSIGPTSCICVKNQQKFFWCMQEAALCIKFLPQQKKALPYKVGSSSPLKWKSQRFIFKNKNKIYWFFIPVKDQYFFFFKFLMSKFGLFFFKTEKN